MRGILTRVQTALLYPRAYATVFAQSELQRLRSRGKAPMVHVEAPYAGQPILLLALYEKGVLRPDIRRLVATAKAAGLYVLAVNTQRLADPASLAGIIDCYVERFNFGRDFGSYRCGFLHIYGRGWHERCPRLLMLNDSVFYAGAPLGAFLADLLDDPGEAVGATENFEIDHHLGSFCLAIAGRILRDARFRRYWRRYRLSDVRPEVIRRGEMGLSRLLKRCVLSPDAFRALYDARRVLDALAGDDALVDFAFRNARDSGLVDWRRASAIAVADAFGREHIADPYASDKIELTVGGNSGEMRNRHHVADVAGARAYLEAHLVPGQSVPADALNDRAVAHLLEVFLQGSQIHQNAVLLLRLGLPIVKLDGMFRGMFSTLDLRRLLRLLPADEAAELARQLLERPFGGATLIGWKRAAFFRGLI